MPDLRLSLTERLHQLHEAKHVSAPECPLCLAARLRRPEWLRHLTARELGTRATVQ